MKDQSPGCETERKRNEMNVMMVKAESVSDMEAAADKMFAAEPPIVEPLTVIGSYELF